MCYYKKNVISYVATPKSLSHHIFKDPRFTRLITYLTIDH